MIEHKETYKGHHFHVWASELGHRCGYVEILSTEPGYGIPHNKNYAHEIDCHGGVTYSALEDGKWIIGFDCAHYRDGKDISIMSASFKKEYLDSSKGSFKKGKIWSTEDVIAECKSMIDQIIVLAAKSKLKFKVGEYQIIMQNTPFYSHKTELTTKMIRGLMSKNFGVNYKTPEHFVYTITHLPTKRQVVTFSTMADAKKFIIQAEAVPDIDNMHLDNALTFAPTLKEIIQKIRRLK